MSVIDGDELFEILWAGVAVVVLIAFLAGAGTAAVFLTVANWIGG